jgi:hypothetical protein
MKFLTKWIACFLIAWLPMLGYPAQASLCSEMTAASPSHGRVMSVMHGSDHAKTMKAPSVTKASACHGTLGSLACAAVALPSCQFVLASGTVSVFQSVSRTLIAQFDPEPPQHPPKAL